MANIHGPHRCTTTHFHSQDDTFSGQLRVIRRSQNRLCIQLLVRNPDMLIPAPTGRTRMGSSPPLKRRLQTSGRGGEAGWFGRRSGQAKPGKVWQAQVTCRLNLLPRRGSCSTPPSGSDWRSVKNAVWSGQRSCGGGAFRKTPWTSPVNAKNPGHDGGARLQPGLTLARALEPSTGCAPPLFAFPAPGSRWLSGASACLQLRRTRENIVPSQALVNSYSAAGHWRYSIVTIR